MHFYTNDCFGQYRRLRKPTPDAASRQDRIK